MLGSALDIPVDVSILSRTATDRDHQQKKGGQFRGFGLDLLMQPQLIGGELTAARRGPRIQEVGGVLVKRVMVRLTMGEAVHVFLAARIEWVILASAPVAALTTTKKLIWNLPSLCGAGLA
jgi:hypothetical protein